MNKTKIVLRCRKFHRKYHHITLKGTDRRGVNLLFYLLEHRVTSHEISQIFSLSRQYIDILKDTLYKPLKHLRLV